MKKIFLILVYCTMASVCFSAKSYAETNNCLTEYSNPINNNGLCGRIADKFCRRMFVRGELDFSWLAYKFEKIDYETIIVFNKFTHQLNGDKRDLIYKIKMKYKSGNPESLSSWKLLLIIIEDVDTQIQLVNKKYE